MSFEILLQSFINSRFMTNLFTFSGALFLLLQAQWAKIFQRTPGLRGKMIVADQANVLPSQRRDMGDGSLGDVLASLAQGGNCFGEIDRIQAAIAAMSKWRQLARCI